MRGDHPATLLIVEDDAGAALLQRIRLERAGYRVELATTAAEGLARIDMGGIDLLILDQNLPGRVSGLALYEQLRNKGSAIPAILVTGVADDQVVLRALRAGVFDFVPKTADFLDYLLATIDRVLRIKATEKRLAESEAQLASIIGSAQDAVLTVGENGRIELCNPAGERMFGQPCSRLTGQPVTALLPSWPDGATALQRLSEQKTGWETEGLRVDGATVPLEVSVSMSEANGRRFWTVLARDTSERRKIQEQRERLLLEQSARREAETARAITEMDAREKARLFAELRESERRKDEFLAMLSHELRNPLAPIRHVLQLVRQSGADIAAAVLENWPIIERQVEHLVRLVDDLLDVSRISRGKVTLQLENTTLAEILKRAIESTAPLIESRGHQLETRLPAETLALNADPVRLVQVFANLLNNAAKYTPAGGRITVDACREGATAVVRVRDTGVGIPDHMLNCVFDLFTQNARTLDRSDGGLGIGLTLVREMTRLHGGEVEARSTGPGLGSEFIVRLPLATAPAAAAAPTPAAATDKPTGRAILLVDDNHDSAATLARLLKRFGHQVRTASSGPDALACLEDFRPEVIILDIGLPGMDGYELAQRLRADRRFLHTTLVALTGYGSAEDRSRSRAAGFHAHLVKPVDFQALCDLLLSPDALRRSE